MYLYKNSFVILRLIENYVIELKYFILYFDNIKILLTNFKHL
jgi:hypothetical protein